MREATIVEQLDRHLSSLGPLTAREVPFLSRYIDLVAYDPRSGDIIAVEAKLENWRRAIDQAKKCLLCADEVYIALPEVFAHRVNGGELAALGIGLFSVGETVSVRLPPKRSELKAPYFHQRMVSLMKQLGDEKGVH